MKTYAFALGQIETNAYLIFPDDSDMAILIDAPYEAAEVIPQILEKNNRHLAAILLTHGHWDHIWDAGKLARITGAKVYAGKDGQELIESPDFQRKNLFAGGDFEAAKIDVFPEDGQILNIAGLQIQCFDAPGHCPGSVIYYIKDKKDGDKAFVGDVIFEESVGRSDLWGGSFAALEKSIRNKIYTLPAQTQLMTGHGASTTVGHEMQNNPYVSA